MQYDENKHKSLVTRWLYRACNGEINDEILFCKNILIFEDMKRLLKRHRRDIKFKVPQESGQQKDKCDIKFESISNRTTLMKQKNNDNIFLSSEQFDTIEYPVGFDMYPHERILLIVPESYILTDEVPENIISNYQGDEVIVSKEERYLYYIEKVDPMDIVKNKDGEKIMDFLKKSISHTNSLFPPRLGLVFDNINYDKSQYSDELKHDILVLIHANLLMSRLAVLVYRLATLNLNANATKSGRYFHEVLGAKSKTYNYKLMREKYKTGSTIEFLPDLLLKNFKAYDLSINEFEVSIRKEIAGNLLHLDECRLDDETISRMTKLPQDTLDELKRDLG